MNMPGKTPIEKIVSFSTKPEKTLTPRSYESIKNTFRTPIPYNCPDVQLIYLTVQFVPIYMEKKNCYIFF